MAQNSPDEPFVSVSGKEILDRMDKLTEIVADLKSDLRVALAERQVDKETISELKSSISSIRMTVARWSGGFAVIVFFAELAISHFVLK